MSSYFLFSGISLADDCYVFQMFYLSPQGVSYLFGNGITFLNSGLWVHQNLQVRQVMSPHAPCSEVIYVLDTGSSNHQLFDAFDLSECRGMSIKPWRFLLSKSKPILPTKIPTNNAANGSSERNPNCAPNTPKKTGTDE